MRRFASILAPTLLIAAIAGPVTAQDGGLERRVSTIEKELRAVQRKVFPGGDNRFFEAEIQPEQQPATPAPGIPASSPVADLGQRVDALEKQIASLTDNVEQNGYRLRQAEEKIAALQAAAAAAAAAAAPPVDSPGLPTGGIVGATPTGPATATAPAATAPANADAIEAAYRAAYAKVDAKDWTGAEADLKAFVAANPTHRRASHAQYWLGRSYVASGKLNLAAEAFLANYQTNPRGERAPDSLLWLGRTLIDLKKAPDACRVLDELQAVYAGKMSSDVRDQATRARATAKCT